MRYFDLSKNVYGFSQDNHPHYKTNLGGFFTVILGILLVLAIISFGNNLFSKTNPKVNTSELISENLFIPRNEIEIFAGYHYASGRFVPDFDRKFQFSLRYNNLTEGFTEVKNFALIKCKDLKFENKYYQEMENEMINKDYPYYCLPEEYNFGLRGLFGTSNFSAITLSVTTCSNSTANNTCFPKSVIDAEPTIYAHVIIKNSLIDPTDYESPLKRSWLNNIVQFKPNSERVQMYNFQRIEVFSDNGFLLENIDVYKGYRMVKEYDEFFYVPNTVRLLNVRFGNSNNYIKINRSYLKVQEMAANIGGILNLFSFILILIGEQYSYFKYLKSLIKNIQKKETKDIPIPSSNSINKIKMNLESEIINMNANNINKSEIDNSKLILKNNLESMKDIDERFHKKENNIKEDELKFEIKDEKHLCNYIDKRIMIDLNSKNNTKVMAIEKFFGTDQTILDQFQLNDTLDILSMISQFFPDFLKTNNAKMFLQFRRKFLQEISIESFLNQKIEHKLMMKMLFPDSNEFRQISERLKDFYGCIF